MPKPPRITSLVKSLARLPPGPLFSSPLQCLRCAAEWVAVYSYPQLTFACHHCGGRALRSSNDAPAFLGGSNFLDEPSVN
jgi:hypothetical protein